MTRTTALMGLVTITLIVSASVRGISQSRPASHGGHAGAGDAVRIRLLALGDINLGRSIGQQILKGDTLYAFACVRDTLEAYDVVFGNLESCLSDQRGETQHPANNLVFTGPPAGAMTLRKGGVQIVSTANNHALDYGLKGLKETMKNLELAGVGYVGTVPGGKDLSGPVVLDREGIRIAFFACTDIMNRPGEGWKRYVAAADTATLLPKIREARRFVDLVVVSYHGGEEYAERPTKRVVEFGRAAVAAGAGLVLGHHPHVPYGMERWREGLIVHSLGNFVFRQPARFWTQRSFALSATIVKDTLGTRIEKYAVLPVICDSRPTFDVFPVERDTIYHRIRTFSSPEVTEFVR